MTVANSQQQDLRIQEYLNRWKANGSDIKQKIPARERDKVEQNINIRTQREMAVFVNKRGRRGLAVVFASALIAVVWQVAGGPTSFMYLLLQLGIPGAMWAIAIHMSAEDEKAVEIRISEIRLAGC